MKLSERIEALAALGDFLKHPNDELIAVVQSAFERNPWFIVEHINQAINAIANNYLSLNELHTWVSKYELPEAAPKKIGLILAGNIPLVGIHDIIAVFISGHKSVIKLSDKDRVLIPYFVKVLSRVNNQSDEYFEFVERLTDYEAIIATGSNTSGALFEKYFDKVPHVIRKNKSGVAIIPKSISDAELKKLGSDIFSYFGLGCRNVSKLYIENDFDISRLFKELDPYSDIINHNKYKNNYDFTNALYLMNEQQFVTNDVLILKEDKHIASRIASVNYEFYTDPNQLEEILNEHYDEIQCVVTNFSISGFDVIPFGSTQSPLLMQYADGVDTIQFLLDLGL